MTMTVCTGGKKLKSMVNALISMNVFNNSQIESIVEDKEWLEKSISTVASRLSEIVDGDYENETFGEDTENTDEDDSEEKKSETTGNDDDETKNEFGSIVLASLALEKVSASPDEHDRWLEKVKSFHYNVPQRSNSTVPDEEESIKNTDNKWRYLSGKVIANHPRTQILDFLSDVAADGEVSGPQHRYLLPQPFDKASIFTVWRPTSMDAIRKMICNEALGKGCDIKGKSSKRGKLSGFVPFLQISKNRHKRNITFFKDDEHGRDTIRQQVARVFFKTSTARGKVMNYLLRRTGVVPPFVAAKAASLRKIDDYTDSDRFGLEIPIALFWESYVMKQDISCEKGSMYDRGRPSSTIYQDMNLKTVSSKQNFERCSLFPYDFKHEDYTETERTDSNNDRDDGYDNDDGDIDRDDSDETEFHFSDDEDDDDDEEEDEHDEEANLYNNLYSHRRSRQQEKLKEDQPLPVLLQNGEDPMNPFELLMAYEDHGLGTVLPVVADFDCFLIGTRRVTYKEPMEPYQVEIRKWTLKQIESILDSTTDTFSESLPRGSFNASLIDSVRDSVRDSIRSRQSSNFIYEKWNLEQIESMLEETADSLTSSRIKNDRLSTDSTPYILSTDSSSRNNPGGLSSDSSNRNDPGGLLPPPALKRTTTAALEDKSWLSRWLKCVERDKEKISALRGSQVGFGDPKSSSIIKAAVRQSRLTSGAVRHGPECFNYIVPQDLDDEYLIISEKPIGNFAGGDNNNDNNNSLGSNHFYQKVSLNELIDFLRSKIHEGYTFPIHPKWILFDGNGEFDDGTEPNKWKELYDMLLNSKNENTIDSMNVWFPPDSGVREDIERIHKKYPHGFCG